MRVDDKRVVRLLAEPRNLPALIACLIIVGVADWILLGESINYLRARSWVETSAVVTHQGVMSDVKGGRSPWARYTYEWQGQRFSSERAHIVKLGRWRVADPQPAVGAKIVCFVNSANPTDACLFRYWPNLMTFLFPVLNLGPLWLLVRAVRPGDSRGEMAPAHPRCD